MSAVDEDTTLTQLTTAWVNLYLVSPQFDDELALNQQWPVLDACCSVAAVKHSDSVVRVYLLSPAQAEAACTQERSPCCTSTHDWTAWVLLSHMSCLQGGKKVEEAFFIFQELGDKYSWTVSTRYSPIRGRGLSPCLAMHCCMCEHG